MFNWFGKKKQKETIQIEISKDLLHVILYGDIDKEFKGIDNSKLALISVKRQSDNSILVGIEFERNNNSDIFNEIHKTIANNANEAIEFFRSYGITNELSWLEGFRRKVSLIKRKSVRLY